MIQGFPLGTETEIEKQARWVSSQNFVAVLDVGGAMKPLRSATHVVDILPFGSQPAEGRGALPERFSRETWLVHDISESWPYSDKQFDYVWCCQVLEDVRDPIFVCREMNRVGKRGFISTVHRSYESGQLGVYGLVGYLHHRWLVEVVGDEVMFTFKWPLLYAVPELRPKVKAHFLNFTWVGELRARENYMYEEGQHTANLLKYKEQND